MGCDIHIYPEAYNGSDWVPAEPFVLSDWWYERILDDMAFEYDDSSYKAEEAKLKSMSESEMLEKYGSDGRVDWSHPFDSECGRRNYSFFAILADVRNYDSESLIPISKPRGIPINISEKVMNLAENECEDAHSHSCYTLKELLDYDWSKIIPQTAIMGKREFMKFYAGKNPLSWSPATEEDRKESISPREMWNVCLGIFNDLDPNGDYRTVVDWDLTRRELVGEKYLDDFLNRLRSYGDPENVRVVFWFDN